MAPRSGTDPRRGKHASSPAPAATNKRTIIIVIAAMLVICAVAVLAWVFLFSESDSDRIQGTWRVAGSDTQVTITDSEIVLTDDVSYGYSLDPFSHELGFSFYGSQGSASYELGQDGDMLTIYETLKRDGDAEETQTLVLFKPGSDAEKDYLAEHAGSTQGASSGDVAADTSAGSAAAGTAADPGGDGSATADGSAVAGDTATADGASATGSAEGQEG